MKKGEYGLFKLLNISCKKFMEKVLCIVGGMNAGGAETFLMKIFRAIDKKYFQMDFCVGNVEKGFYDDEIIKNGGKIIHVTKKSKNPIKSFFEIRKIVKKGKYHSVIRISQHSLSAIDLLAAKLGGAQKCVFRSSNSNSCGNLMNRFLHNIFIPLAIFIPNVKIAPSDKAAIHMFGKKQLEKGKVKILNNGLDVKSYKFNEEVRKNKRNELKLNDNDFLIGHVGRMTKQKNHKFLIDIFIEFLKKNNNAKLLLIGDGELKNDISIYIKDKHIENYVYFLGIRSDTNELYQAMDCFVFPSLYEGMPNTVIEAQTSGLKCIISNKITREVNLTNNVSFCDLSNIKDWVSKIEKSEKREQVYKQVFEKGYDISDVVNTFIEYIK